MKLKPIFIVIIIFTFFSCKEKQQVSSIEEGIYNKLIFKEKYEK